MLGHQTIPHRGHLLHYHTLYRTLFGHWRSSPPAGSPAGSLADNMVLVRIAVDSADSIHFGEGKAVRTVLAVGRSIPRLLQEEAIERRELETGNVLVVGSKGRRPGGRAERRRVVVIAGQAMSALAVL
jgi:hypothetical protein